MAVRLKFYGKEFNRALKKATADGLQRATLFYHRKCRESLNTPNTGRRVRVKRQTAGGNKSSRTIYPNPSKPGEPPRKRTGWGQRHVVQEFDRNRVAGRVGVAKNAMYMLFLELGTPRVKRRPWLVATLMKNQGAIGRLAVSSKL